MFRVNVELQIVLEQSEILYARRVEGLKYISGATDDTEGKLAPSHEVSTDIQALWKCLESHKIKCLITLFIILINNYNSTNEFLHSVCKLILATH